jgi:hypothetical protein
MRAYGVFIEDCGLHILYFLNDGSGAYVKLGKNPCWDKLRAVWGRAYAAFGVY